MNIKIDKDRCVGNARYWAIAPDLYEMNDDGYITIDGFDVPERLVAIARRGARACPENVITIVED